MQHNSIWERSTVLNVSSQLYRNSHEQYIPVCQHVVFVCGQLLNVSWELWEVSPTCLPLYPFVCCVSCRFHDTRSCSRCSGPGRLQIRWGRKVGQPVMGWLVSDKSHLKGLEDVVDTPRPPTQQGNIYLFLPAYLPVILRITPLNVSLESLTSAQC